MVICFNKIKCCMLSLWKKFGNELPGLDHVVSSETSISFE